MAYTASKHGLVGFSRALNSEYCARGISSCAVCPSFAPTALLADLVEKAGGARPVPFATTTLEAVADACVRAVVTEEPEIIVNRLPMRPAIVLFEAFPTLPSLVDAWAPWLYEFNRKCGL